MKSSNSVPSSMFLHGSSGSLPLLCLSNPPAPSRPANQPTAEVKSNRVLTPVRPARGNNKGQRRSSLTPKCWQLLEENEVEGSRLDETLEAMDENKHSSAVTGSANSEEHEKSADVPMIRVDLSENDLEKTQDDTPTDEYPRPIDESHLPKNLKIYSGNLMKVISATDLTRELPDVKTPTPATINESRVLVLYTGGTIGMKSKDGVYRTVPGYLPAVIRGIPPLNDKQFIDAFYSNASVVPYSLPPIRNMKNRVIYWIVEYDPLLDSCDMTFDDWIRVASDIRKAYYHYDGFVVLHGTDTIAYTASALSFMMENLGKPVIITGSQIPVAEVRSDGMDNLIGALVTAGNLDIPEVCVYFNNKLLRGNRAVKTDNSALAAFDSPNMQPLARMNINIKVNYESIFRSDTISPFAVQTNLCRNVGMLRIFPSMTITSVRAFLQPPTEGVILQTFGAGNMPTRRVDILEALKDAIERGVLVVNTTQCLKGQVDMYYATGKVLYDIGVIPASDMTAEGAMAKMCYVLGKTEWNHEEKRKMLQQNLRGEMTITRKGDVKQLDIIPQIARALHMGTTKEIMAVKGALLPALVCHAANCDNVALLEQLRESGAVFSLPDYNQRTALHVAASVGNLNAVNYLLHHGVNVHTKDTWGYSALMCAVKCASMDCIAAIRKAGGAIEYDQNGMELCYAASHGDLRTLEAYAAAGCNMEAPDYDGRTALHLAVSHKRPEVINYLLQLPVQPNIKDFVGTTPLDEAKKMKWEEAQVLISAAERSWIERVAQEKEAEQRLLEAAAHSGIDPY